MEFYDFEDQVVQMATTGNIQKAIELAESEFKKLEKTDFHKVLGRSLLHLESDVDGFMNSIYEKSQEALGADVRAIYCEMNGFDINYELWFVTGFSFTFCNSLDDTDWLADYEYAFDMALVISGFEDLQKTYEDYMVNKKWKLDRLELASNFCTLLITLRLLELFKASFEKYKGISEWTKIPVFVTAHESEAIYRTIDC